MKGKAQRIRLAQGQAKFTIWKWYEERLKLDGVMILESL